MHPHGIKVRLRDRQVGRVIEIIEPCPASDTPESKKTIPQSITVPESTRNE
jgi:hypothetical protein